MTDIMVDLETTGTKPAYSGILQLAAVKFNLEEQQIGETFDRCPSLLPNRFWDEGTREFWGTMPAIYGSFVARQEDAEEVFIDFSKWVTKDAPSSGYRFWAKPTTFDWTMLASHFEQIRSEEHTSELQSLMRISYAVFCLKKKKHTNHISN